MFRISCLCLILAGMAFGQEALPIYVSFEFQVPAVANLFPPGRLKELESQIAKSLAESCAARIPYWTFQTGPANAFPRLAISLNEHADWSIQMELRREAGRSDPGQVWTATLFTAGEIGRRGFPGPDKWAPVIRAAFDERMLDKKDQLLAVLRDSIPLGKLVLATEATPSSAEKARAILPLRWDRYGVLALSKFRIDYNLANQGRVKLQSQGIGLPLIYSGPQPYCGIVVQHRKYVPPAGEPDDISKHLAIIGHLTPVAFYLQEIEDAGELPVCEH